MFNFSSPEIDRQQEDRDLMEIKQINDDIRDLEIRKHKIVQRLVARYQSAATTEEPSRNAPPVFDDPLQQHAYDYLSQIGSSTTKPMGDFARGKGYDFAGAPKPGLKFVTALKKRPDVFSYEPKTEEWSLIKRRA